MGGCASMRPPHEKRFRRAIKLYEVGEVRSLTNLFNRNRCFESGDTPLTLAALEGHEAVVETLLGSGANVNRIDANGRCPLHIAVQQNVCCLVSPSGVYWLANVVVVEKG